MSTDDDDRTRKSPFGSPFDSPVLRSSRTSSEPGGEPPKPHPVEDKDSPFQPRRDNTEELPVVEPINYSADGTEDRQRHNPIASFLTPKLIVLLFTLGAFLLVFFLLLAYTPLSALADLAITVILVGGATGLSLLHFMRVNQRKRELAPTPGMLKVDTTKSNVPKPVLQRALRSILLPDSENSDTYSEELWDAQRRHKAELIIANLRHLFGTKWSFMSLLLLILIAWLNVDPFHWVPGVSNSPILKVATAVFVLLIISLAAMGSLAIWLEWQRQVYVGLEENMWLVEQYPPFFWWKPEPQASGVEVSRVESFNFSRPGWASFFHIHIGRVSFDTAANMDAAFNTIEGLSRPEDVVMKMRLAKKRIRASREG